MKGETNSNDTSSPDPDRSCGTGYAIDPLTDMSTRYVCKAVSEGNRVAGGSLDDLHAECKLATLRITRRLDMSKYKTDSRHKSAGEEIGENKQEKATRGMGVTVSLKPPKSIGLM